MQAAARERLRWGRLAARTQAWGGAARSQSLTWTGLGPEAGHGCVRSLLGGRAHAAALPLVASPRQCRCSAFNPAPGKHTQCCGLAPSASQRHAHRCVGEGRPPVAVDAGVRPRETAAAQLRRVGGRWGASRASLVPPPPPPAKLPGVNGAH